MILINNGTNPFSCNGFILPKGKRTDVPEAIAAEFLKIDSVEEYIAPADVEKAAKIATAELAAKVAELEKENAELKAKLEKLAEDSSEEDSKTLEELKKEADELGITYSPNIGVPTLSKRIEEKKAELAAK